MKPKNVVRLLAVIAAVVTVAAACSSDNKSSGAGSSASSSKPAADFVALGGWKDPACDTSLPKVSIGVSNPIDVPGTSLKEYSDAAQASVVAFNSRGGIKGRCLDLQVCDNKFDGPTEVACARQFTDDSSVVAAIASTYSVSEADAYQLFESAGLAQIGPDVATPSAWNSPVSYDFTMGGSGTLLAGMPALKSVGVTKFAIFVPASGAVGSLNAFAQPIVDALGMNLVQVIQIPPTAVDFTQFVLAAENAGAEGAVVGLPSNTASQIIDAADSVNSPLKLAAAFGTFSRSDIQNLPEAVVSNMAFDDAIPPPSADTTRWPIYNVITDDLKAGGLKDADLDHISSQSTQSWLSIYALIKVMRDSGATDITRATVKQALDQAQNVPMFDLLPPWTPSKQSTNAIFKGISNPFYWTGHWDADKKNFVVDDKQVDIVGLLG